MEGNRLVSRMMANKKGMMALDQIVIVIVLVATFAIILFFYGLFMWNPTIDKAACHQSVVLRGSLNAGIFEAGKKIIPLKCETEKICLTMGGVCDEFGKASKTNKVTTVKLSKDKSKAQEKVRETIANALFDCHSMLGEGKINFMSQPLTQTKYCLICSRFALDSQAKAIVDDLSYIDLYSYMKTKKTSGGNSYLKFTYDVERVDGMFEILEKARELYNENNEKNPSGDFISEVGDLKIDMQTENAIISQIVPDSTWDKWGVSAVAGTAVAAGVILAPFTVGSSLTLTGVGIAVLAGTTTTGIMIVKQFPDGARYFHPSVYSYNVEALRDLKCNSFEAAP